MTAVRRRQRARITGLLLLAVAGLALALAAARGPQPQAKPIVLASGAMRASTSHPNEAILGALGMSPGQSVQGEVTVGNEGSGVGHFALIQRRRSQQAGRGDGFLYPHLQLEVQELRAGSTALVYSGDIGAIGVSNLGRIDPGGTRSYSFRVTLPDGGVPTAPDAGDNRFQDASLSVDYRWLARPDPPDPEIQCRYGSLWTNGAETIEGTGNDDRILAKDGGDLVRSRGGTDCVFGGRGDDDLNGGRGADELRGGHGDDVIRGGPGPDLIRGRQDDDVLIGGPGPDLLRGTGGDDEIRAVDGESDRIRCGPGHDVAFVDSSDQTAGCEQLRG